MKKLYVLLGCLCLLLNSCSMYPSIYEDEIKDYVKYTLSVLDYLETDYSNPTLESELPILGKMLTPLAIAYDERLQEFGDYMSTQAKELGSYEAALRKEASDEDYKYYKEANKIYTHYSERLVSLSKFEELTKWDESVKIWTFSDIRSGLGFVFTYDFDNDDYRIETNNESLDQYITKKFL